MVEGPGCKLNGEKLKKRVIGQKVVGLAGTSLQKSRIQKPDEAMAYNCFVGKRVTDVKTLGKELFVFVEAEFCLRVHFLMNGSLRFNNEFMQSDTKKKESVLKLILSTDCVYFYDISLEIRSAFESQQKYKELIDLDICSPTFNLQRAVHTIRQHTTRLICDVVLDQLVLPGVGNIIKNEALFNAGINPNTKVDELNEDLIILLVKMNRDFTKLFYECRRDGKNLYKFMKIYKKSECQECRRKVVQCKVGEYERLTFYCPGCQNNTMKLPIKSSLLGWVFHQQDVWSCVACTLENEVASWRCSLCLTPRPPPESFPALHHNPSATATGTKRTLDGGMQSPGSSKRSTSVGDPSNFQSSGHVKHSSSSATSHGGDHDRVVCPGHKTEARKCKVVKEGDNKGRVFYTCSKPQGQQCKFFLWGDNHHPMCHHGKVTVQRTVLKLNANNGRHFYCCSRPKNKQCDFFQWVDADGVGELGLSEEHCASVSSYLRFNKYQRAQRLRSIEACFQDVKDTRLVDDSYTVEEVMELLDCLGDVVKAEVEGELLHACHTNSLLLTKLLKQAQKWHLTLNADTSDLENQELLEEIKKFEEKEGQHGRAGSIPSPKKRTLAPLNEAEGPLALLQAEIQRLMRENADLSHRVQEAEKMMSEVAKGKTEANLNLVLAKDELNKIQKSLANQPTSEDVTELCNEVERMRMQLSNEIEAHEASQDQLAHDLSSSKESLQQVRAQLQLAEKELEKKFSQTGAFQNMKKMLNKKNEQIKAMRKKLSAYEPNSEDGIDE